MKKKYKIKYKIIKTKKNNILGKTISMIKCNNGNIIGGFTSIPWYSAMEQTIHRDDSAFLFKMRNISFKDKPTTVKR